MAAVANVAALSHAWLAKLAPQRALVFARPASMSDRPSRRLTTRQTRIVFSFLERDDPNANETDTPADE